MQPTIVCLACTAGWGSGDEDGADKYSDTDLAETGGCMLLKAFYCLSVAMCRCGTLSYNTCLDLAHLALGRLLVLVV